MVVTGLDTFRFHLFPVLPRQKSAGTWNEHVNCIPLSAPPYFTNLH